MQLSRMRPQHHLDVVQDWAEPPAFNTGAWPQPPPASPMLSQLHARYGQAKATRKPKRRWRRWVLVSVVAFAGGVYARPFLEHQARTTLAEIPAEAAFLVGQAKEQLPDWLQPRAAVTPEPVVARSAPTQNVITPLPAEAPVAPASPPEIVPEAPPPAPVVVAEANEPPPAPSEAPAEAAPVAEERAPAKPRTRHRTRQSAREPAKVAAAPPVTAAAEPAVATAKAEVPAPAKAEVPAQNAPADPLDNLLMRALRDDEATAPSAAGSASKAKALGRQQIAEAMRTVNAVVNDCGAGLPHATNADLSVTVDAAGQVTAVKVSGPLFATMTGGCIVRAVKSIEFPPSQGATFPYRYMVVPRAKSHNLALADEPKPERITRADPEPAALAPAKPASARSRSAAQVPRKKAVGDDPLAGIGGLGIEGRKGQSQPDRKDKKTVRRRL